MMADNLKTENFDIEFDNICRLCMTVFIDDNSLIDIFNNNEKCSLSLRIMACVSLEVQYNDNLPKKICYKCRHQLEKFQYFRNKSKNTDTKLRRHIRCINAGKRSHLFDESDGEFEDENSESIEFLKKWEANEEENRQQVENKRISKIQEQFLANINLKHKKMLEEEKKKMYEEFQKKFDEKLAEEMEKRCTRSDELVELIEPHQQQAKKRKKPNETDKNSNQTRVLNFINKVDVPIKIEDMIMEIRQKNDETDVEPNDDQLELINENCENNDDDNNYDYSYDDTDEQKTINPLEDEDCSYDVNSVDQQSQSYTTEMNDNHDSDSDYDTSVTVPIQVIVKPENIKTKPSAANQSSSATFEIEYLDDTSELSPNHNHDSECDDDDDDDGDNLSQYVHLPNDNDNRHNVVPAKKFNIVKHVPTIYKQKIVYQQNIEVEDNDGNKISLQFHERDPSAKAEETNLEADEHGLKVFDCDQCPAKFSRRIQLIRHMYSALHVSKPGQICEFCDKWFPSKSSLTRHTRTHTGEKPFKCTECGRSFIQKEILKRHQMTHTGERPYQCDSCEKAFTQKEMLRQHINKMHTENPIQVFHQCPKCPKTFHHASGLSRHLLVHTGMKFGCEFCQKKFNDKSALKRHITSLHKPEPESFEEFVLSK